MNPHYAVCNISKTPRKILLLNKCFTLFLFDFEFDTDKLPKHPYIIIKMIAADLQSINVDFITLKQRKHVNLFNFYEFCSFPNGYFHYDWTLEMI